MPLYLPVTFLKGKLLSEVLLEANIIDSIGEFKRLVKEGAVTVNEEQKVESFGFSVDQNITVKVGKKRFLKVVLG